MELPSTSWWRRLSLSTVAAALVRPVRVPGGPARPEGTKPGPVVPGSGVPDPGVPVILGGVRVRQTDRTTCGSTVLLMLAATGDPVLARWLEHGDLPAGLTPHQVPPEIPPALRPPAGSTSVPPTTVTQRLTAAQQHIKRRTSARALGLLSWPGRFGTPPWTAAREARFPGVRYRGRPFDDAARGAAALLTSVYRTTRAGVPVPLYTCGDLGRGLTTALPRHVVLAVPPPAGAEPGEARVLHLYDPAGGKVYQVPLGDLLRRTAPHPALGGWSHVCWVLMPSRAARAGVEPSSRSTARPSTSA